MADQLNMGNLSLGGQQPPARSYIPPHMRGKMGGPQPGPPPMNAGPTPMDGPPRAAGLNQSAWSK